MIKVTTVFLALAMIGWNAFGEETESFTLERAIELATQAATEIIKARNNDELAAIQVLQSYGQFLPNLQVNGSYNREHGRAYLWEAQPVMVDTSDYGDIVQLSTSINLFNGLADVSGLNAAMERVSAAKYTLARAKEQIALDVSQAFMQVIFDRKIIEISETDLAVSRERQNLLEQQTKIGLNDVADLYRQQALTSQNESSRIVAQNRLRADELALIKRLRLDPRKKYDFIEPKVGAPAVDKNIRNENDMIESALSARLDLRASEKLLEASRLDVKTAESTYYPRLDFGYSLNEEGRILDSHSVDEKSFMPLSQDSLGSQMGNQILYTVGVTLTWNIFDRNLTKSAQQRANVAVRNAEVDREDLRNSIVSEIREAYGDYVNSKSQLVSDERGQQAAQRAYDVLQGRYSVGAAKFVDLIDSQAALVHAKSAYAQSIYNVELKRRALQVASGLPIADP